MPRREGHGEVVHLLRPLLGLAGGRTERFCTGLDATLDGPADTAHHPPDQGSRVEQVDRALDPWMLQAELLLFGSLGLDLAAFLDTLGKAFGSPADDVGGEVEYIGLAGLGGLLLGLLCPAGDGCRGFEGTLRRRRLFAGLLYGFLFVWACVGPIQVLGFGGLVGTGVRRLVSPLKLVGRWRIVVGH